MKVYPFRRAITQIERGGVDISVFLGAPKRDEMATPLFALGQFNVLVISMKTNPIQKLSDFSG